jgi:K+-sensing histidine kinase KdpD
MDREVLNGEGTLSTLRHGSGLGLWLVKLIVDHSNGTVYYDTNTVPGNVVTIELQTPPRH